MPGACANSIFITSLRVHRRRPRTRYIDNSALNRLSREAFAVAALFGEANFGWIEPPKLRYQLPPFHCRTGRRIKDDVRFHVQSQRNAERLSIFAVMAQDSACVSSISAKLYARKISAMAQHRNGNNPTRRKRLSHFRWPGRTLRHIGDWAKRFTRDVRFAGADWRATSFRDCT